MEEWTNDQISRASQRPPHWPPKKATATWINVYFKVIFLLKRTGKAHSTKILHPKQRRQGHRWSRPADQPHDPAKIPSSSIWSKGKSVRKVPSIQIHQVRGNVSPTRTPLEIHGRRQCAGPVLRTWLKRKRPSNKRTCSLQYGNLRAHQVQSSPCWYRAWQSRLSPSIHPADILLQSSGGCALQVMRGKYPSFPQGFGGGRL
ncbi:uncharacterized protein [Aquarana catesbeiana]|uniref:uncharacterized protein n=1 Tax=Aquarana catesbeiana TaxID=8400 RepID=UPI003CC93986